MKLELRREEKLDGSFVYTVYMDDKYVENTVRLDEEKALKIYEFVKVNGAGGKVTTIKQEEI